MFNLEGIPFFYIGFGVLLILILSQAIYIIKEYQRAVVFRLGRLISTKGPGLILVIPILDKVVRVPLRTVVYDVPEQEVVTRDNVTCRVNAVLYYRVVDPEKAIVNVEEYHQATIQLAQTTMRSIAGQADLDELLSEREKLNQELQQVIDEATDPWGIKVSAVELKDVVIPSSMQRAIAKQAEAERERRAVVIQAKGEKQAAQKIAEATAILNTEYGAMNLRTLRTISEVSSSEGTTVVFPMPMELLRYFSRGEEITRPEDQSDKNIDDLIDEDDEEMIDDDMAAKDIKERFADKADETQRTDKEDEE
ncbi:MAG: slipin family protein [Bacillota bacterium]